MNFWIEGCFTPVSLFAQCYLGCSLLRFWQWSLKPSCGIWSTDRIRSRSPSCAYSCPRAVRSKSAVGLGRWVDKLASTRTLYLFVRLHYDWFSCVLPHTSQQQLQQLWCSRVGHWLTINEFVVWDAAFYLGGGTRGRRCRMRQVAINAVLHAT